MKQILKHINTLMLAMIVALTSCGLTSCGGDDDDDDDAGSGSSTYTSSQTVLEGSWVGLDNTETIYLIMVCKDNIIGLAMYYNNSSFTEIGEFYGTFTFSGSKLKVTYTEGGTETMTISNRKTNSFRLTLDGGSYFDMERYTESRAAMLPEIPSLLQEDITSRRSTLSMPAAEVLQQLLH